jgi:hypothetical protein
MHAIIAFALAVSAAVLAPTAHAASPLPEVEVTTCGQVIPKKTLGYLTADLDCTGFTGAPADIDPIYAGAAVYLGKKSRFDLRGFTVTGGKQAVICDAFLRPNGKPVSKGPCEIFNGTLNGTVDSVNGIVGYRPNVHHVTLGDFRFGITSLDQLDLGNSTVAGNEVIGVAGKKLTITATAITNNGYFGVDGWTDRGHGVRLIDSTVIDNGDGELCGLNPCADLGSVKPPRLQNSSCGSSLKVGGSGTWGICAHD